MKKSSIIWSIVILVGMVLLASGCQSASADDNDRSQVALIPLINQQASPTLLSTAPPVIVAGYPTPESRVLPPVGSNAGLVIGASVLVLIIIGGILSARSRSKH